MSAEHSCSVFADESGTGEQYLAIGGILLPTSSVSAVEYELDTYCNKHGFEGREMSWKKCSRSKAERYSEFIQLFWTLQEFGPLDFRALLIDQGRYPLAYGRDTEEQGFYRFYHFFLSRSIAIAAPQAISYQLHVAITPDRYRYRTEILQKTVGGTIGRTRGRTWQIVEVIRNRPKLYRVHQLADVLLGAVTYRANERGEDSHKSELVRLVESRIGRRLNEDFKPADRPFNVWPFARKGEYRWAPGARGRVG